MSVDAQNSLTAKNQPTLTLTLTPPKTAINTTQININNNNDNGNKNQSAIGKGTRCVSTSSQLRLAKPHALRKPSTEPEAQVPKSSLIYPSRNEALSCLLGETTHTGPNYGCHECGAVRPFQSRARLYGEAPERLYR